MKVFGAILYFIISPFDCLLRLRVKDVNKMKNKDKEKDKKEINKFLFGFLVFLISVILSALIILAYIYLTRNNIIED